MFTDNNALGENKISNFEQGSLPKEKVIVDSPVARLKSRYDHWVQSGANEHVLDVVRSGYKIPFKEIPESVILKKNKSARENVDFVENEINKLSDKGCISEVADVPHVVNPLTVAVNRSGKKRLVLD